MQNGTRWKSSQIWGFAQAGEAITYSFHFWALFVLGTCPGAHCLILLWIYAELHWMKICTNFLFSAQLPKLENPVTYSFWIWGPSISGTYPIAHYLILLWISAEWDWMKIRTVA